MHYYLFIHIHIYIYLQFFLLIKNYINNIVYTFIIIIFLIIREFPIFFINSGQMHLIIYFRIVIDDHLNINKYDINVSCNLGLINICILDMYICMKNLPDNLFIEINQEYIIIPIIFLLFLFYCLYIYNCYLKLFSNMTSYVYIYIYIKLLNSRSI